MGEYERIRVMWPDHLGIARGKYLPADIAGRGTGHCASVFGLGYDRSVSPAPGSYMLEGLKDVQSNFDPQTLKPGWEDDRTSVAVGHLEFEGEPYPFAARFALQKAIADWQDLGYTPRIGFELEAYVLEPDNTGGWRLQPAPRSYVYGTGATADPTGIIDEIMWVSAASGLKLESVNAEFDESQFELTLQHDEALAAADDAFLFRVMAREIALKRGQDLTFMGKPFNNMSGSGVHVNFSLNGPDGHNAFIDVNASDGLSALARSSLAGLCTHHKAMTALCAPTVNAYRRLRPGEFAGYWANWGYEHRFACNRVPDARGAATRIESRLADGSANIHLAAATVLQAARLGVTEELACPEPLTTDGFEEINTDVSSADNLGDALADLSADSALIQALGADLCANFLFNKGNEWDRYIAAGGNPEPSDQVSEWEISQYLNYH